MMPQPSATHSTRPRKPDRLLILACSQRKRPDPGHIPAIERYDGPLWQTLRSIDPHGEAAQVAFLSALYGLRDARWADIPAYNLLLTDQLAEKMIHGGIETRWPRPSSPRLPDTAGVHPASEIASMAHSCSGSFHDVALVGGHRYLRVLHAWLPAFVNEGWISPTARLTTINAPIGIMRQQLRAWTLEAPCSSI